MGSPLVKNLADDILTLLKVFIAAIIGFFILANCFGIAHWNMVLFAVFLLLNIIFSTLIAVMMMILVIMIGEYIWLRFKQLFD